MAGAEHPDSGSHPASGTTRTRAASSVSLTPSLPEAAPYVVKTRKWALVAVVLLSFLGAATIAAPLWIAVVLGVVLAVSAHRPYRILCRKLGGRASWAAGLTTLAAGLLVAFAGSTVLVALANELMKLVTHLNEQGSAGSLEGVVGTHAANAISNLGVDTAKLYAWAQRELEAAATFAAATTAVVVRTTSEALLGLVVALMTMYYVLIEGPGIARRIERIAPLEPRHTRALLVEAREVARTAFIGTIATAVVQGVFGGIGYAALGVPQPLLWAAATALASFLPVIGTLIIWVPISGYLLLEGHPVRAIILVAWGVLVITSLADYVIRPRIVGGRRHGHPLLTLIALLGGIEVFGLAGLIIAPIIMSVFVAAFRLYEREVRAGGVPGTCVAESPNTPSCEEQASAARSSPAT
ncbi:MAG: AI-2E family transporter [Labilithrix sp.]|nr:AI-2E family transporter [Labilithrix sp.]MCW5833292.1 AI-2E family transporter [Labilithrix sp.]